MKHQDVVAVAAQNSTAFDHRSVARSDALYPFTTEKKPGFDRAHFVIFKRAYEIGASLALLPVLALCAAVLLILNPFLNRGPLFFIQDRMGRDCRPFRAIKFRSMRPVSAIARGADCPVETDRITKLGHFMRKTRIDELPQILNVIGGDMSLIGPRPDYYDHACHFLEKVPGYRERHAVRPGISGLAQTEVGYVENTEGTRRKVEADLHYIQHSGFRLEAWIFFRTLAVIFARHGQ